MDIGENKKSKARLVEHPAVPDSPAGLKDALLAPEPAPAEVEVETTRVPAHR